MAVGKAAVGDGVIVGVGGANVGDGVGVGVNGIGVGDGVALGVKGVGVRDGVALRVGEGEVKSESPGEDWVGVTLGTIGSLVAGLSPMGCSVAAIGLVLTIRVQPGAILSVNAITAIKRFRFITKSPPISFVDWVWFTSCQRLVYTLDQRRKTNDENLPWSFVFPHSGDL